MQLGDRPELANQSGVACLPRVLRGLRSLRCVTRYVVSKERVTSSVLGSRNALVSRNVRNSNHVD